MKRFVFGMLNPSKAGAPPEGDMTVAKVCGFAARSATSELEVFGNIRVEIKGGGAVFSSDGLYRYRLWRDLAVGPPTRPNPVLCRVDVVNMFAFVSTKPEALLTVMDPVGPENATHIDAALEGADVLIAAWGALAPKPVWLRAHAETLLRKMTLHGNVLALATNVDGSPAHPSRLPYSNTPRLYRNRRAAA